MRFVTVADEVFDSVDDEIIAVLFGEGFHAAQIRADAGFCHGKAISFFAAHSRKEIAIALFSVAGHQDVGRAAHAGPVQSIVGAAQFLFVEAPCERVEARTSALSWNVCGIKARCNGFGL